MTKLNYANSLKSLHAMKAKVKALEDDIKRKQQEIIDAMKADGLEEITAGGFTGKYSTFETKRLDTASLKKNMPDLYEQYSKASTTTRFTIK